MLQLLLMLGAKEGSVRDDDKDHNLFSLGSWLRALFVGLKGE